MANGRSATNRESPGSAAAPRKPGTEARYDKLVSEAGKLALALYRRQIANPTERGVVISTSLYEMILEQHELAAASLVDSHGDVHRLIVTALKNAAPQATLEEASHEGRKASASESPAVAAPIVPSASGSTSEKPRTTYVPLTMERIDDIAPAESELAANVVITMPAREFNVLCSMARSSLLYGQEIERLRSLPVSATVPANIVALVENMKRLEATQKEDSGPRRGFEPEEKYRERQRRCGSRAAEIINARFEICDAVKEAVDRSGRE